MQYNLSGKVQTIDGTFYKNSAGADDTLLNICKIVVSQPLQDDPKTIEHINKSLRVYQKLEVSEDGTVEFKKESMTFIRDRMIKMGVPYLVIFDFNRLIDGDPTQSQIDDV